MKKVSIVLTFVTAVLVLVTLMQSNSIRNLRQEVNNRGMQIQEYEANATTTPIEPIEPKENDLEKELTKSQSQNSTLTKTISRLEGTNLELKDEVSTLKQQIVLLKEENEQLETKLELYNSTPNYLRIKFWYDGKNYEISNEDIKLYKNPYLSRQEIEKVIIVSPTISEDRLENGHTIYTVMSNKGLIFMSSYPNLVELEGSFLKAPESAFSDKENKKYLSLIFWQGDCEKILYQDSNQYWYLDCYLFEQIEDSTSIVIVSENPDNFEMSNKITVYSAFTQDGKVVWMSEAPSLETIQ